MGRARRPTTVEEIRVADGSQAYEYCTCVIPGPAGLSDIRSEQHHHPELGNGHLVNGAELPQGIDGINDARQGSRAGRPDPVQSLSLVRGRLYGTK